VVSAKLWPCDRTAVVFVVIARLFPLRFTFPDKLTRPWPHFLNDMIKHAYIPEMVAALFNASPLLQRLERRAQR
jgi:hypothetical protein